MLVIDSSAALSWVLKDERGEGLTLLERMADESAIVPVHWVLEVTNALRMAVQRERLQPGDRQAVIEQLMCLSVTVDVETVVRGWSEIPALADRYALTTYDASYLELALRADAPLATLDKDLARAARAAKVPLYGIWRGQTP
jgi:predicted nucleic acid-binding protein